MMQIPNLEGGNEFQEETDISWGLEEGGGSENGMKIQELSCAPEAQWEDWKASQAEQFESPHVEILKTFRR